MEGDELVVIRDDLPRISRISGVRRDIGEERRTLKLFQMTLGINSCNISSIHAG